MAERDDQSATAAVAPGSLNGSHKRSLAALATGQGLGLSGAPLVVMVGSVVGQDLTPVPGLATLPLATLVVGTALVSGPAALLMQRVGRRRGFAVGAAVAAGASLLAAVAIGAESFALFSAATLLLGGNLAFVQQYRFAAAEVGGQGGSARAVALVLAGGIAAGVIGPEIGRRGRDLMSAPYAGSFVALAAVYVLVTTILLAGLADDHPSRGRLRERAAGPGRAATGEPVPLLRPTFLLPVLAGVTAYSVMTLVMTATPLAMQSAGHGIDAVALVIQAHVVAMYAPSLLAGILAARLGVARLMAAGVATMATSLLLGSAGNDVWIWAGSLVLLGIGWNLLFLGATVALARSFSGADRFRAQALNDTLVFGAQAGASLGAGLVLVLGGWRAVSAAALIPLSAMAVLLVVRHARRRVTSPAG